MTKIGFQVSSIREYLQTPEEVMDSFKKISQMGYKTVQIQWISPEVSSESINQALQENGLDCIGTQDYYGEVMSDLDQVIKNNNLWGGKYICVSGIPEKFQSYEGCLEFAEKLNQDKSFLKEEGKILCFHPRAQEFKKYQGQIALDIILDQTEEDFQICLDVFQVKKAGYDPVKWINKLEGKIDLVHFKDMASVPEGKYDLTPIGQGTLEWEEIFEACKQNQVKYGFAEQERWKKDPFQCFEESYQFITSFGIKP